MMIDAEIYGMIPRAKMVKPGDAPPENRLNTPEDATLLTLEQIRQCNGIDSRNRMCAPIR